ncbi:hypothetical protein T12_12607 [Trichinella patagoniensis]|uniref:Uncharacterized protein n=1 Tax=Trichinella patagoniensis TaxID=990121 RepID=A0A0V0ZZB4_9BILA|nr:hypothetical protein T12_12607 [Trichinella patagoniensis]
MMMLRQRLCCRSIDRVSTSAVCGWFQETKFHKYKHFPTLNCTLFVRSFVQSPISIVTNADRFPLRFGLVEQFGIELGALFSIFNPLDDDLVVDQFQVFCFQRKRFHRNAHLHRTVAQQGTPRRHELVSLFMIRA